MTHNADSVRVYRAVPASVDAIRPGDWVALDSTYCAAHGDACAEQSGVPWHVLTLDVPADGVEWAGPDKDEWWQDEGEKREFFYRPKGLYMVEESFAILPNAKGPDFVQALFIIGDRALDGRGIEEELSPDDQKIKDEFDALIMMDEDLAAPPAPIDMRKDDAVEDLKSWLEGDGDK